MNRTNTGKGSRRGYYTRYLAHYTKKNHTVLLLGGLFLVGTLLGTLLVRSAGSETLELLLRLIGDFSSKRRTQTFTENFTTEATGALLMLGAIFLCGLCAVARPAIVCVPLVRGLGFGFSAASLYASYGSAAVGFVAVFLLPGMLITTVALLFCCHEAMRMSRQLWRLLLGGPAEDYSARLYCARFIAAAMLCAVAALLEAVLYALFSGAFVLL